MSDDGRLRFITRDRAEHEQQSTGLHHWLSRSGMTEAEQLMLVRVYMPAGQGHSFHRHPELEEIIYVISGTAEQWVEEERRLLGPGEAAHIPRDIVHATFNGGEQTLEFLAILSPARHVGPFLVEVFEQEPWCSLRAAAGPPETRP